MHRAASHGLTHSQHLYHPKRGKGTVLMKFDVIDSTDEPETDEFNAMARNELLARVHKNIQDMKVTDKCLCMCFSEFFYEGH